MDTLLHDLRYALRALRKSPGFTTVAVLTLALGIGANTAIFSVLYGVLLRPLPYYEPDRLVGLSQTWRGGRGRKDLTYRQFRFFAEQSRVFESFVAATAVGFNLATGREADRVRGLRVSRDYFRVLGAAPRLGRDFLAEEDQPGGPSAIILSHGLWQRRFGGDSGVVGRAIALDGRPTVVVGVMPPGFQSLPAAEAWSTLAQVGQSIGGGSNLFVIGRLRPGLTPAQARSGWAVTVAAYREAFPRALSPESVIDLEPTHALVVRDLKTPVGLLFGAVGFVLLIACANVANLMLGRAASRSRELAVRVTLGATRGRLMRQLLTESVLLALVGGAVGLLVATWGLRLLLALAPGALPSVAIIELDGWALAFTLGLCLLTGLGFGLMPAWQAARADLHDAIKEGPGRGGGTARQGRLRHVLVVAEVALSLVLLVGAGLLIQTFARLLGTDPGFDTRHVVAAEIWLTGSRYDSTHAIAGFYRDLTARMEALPGVRSAAVVEAGLPLQYGGNTPVKVEGQDPQSVDYRAITPGFFATLGVALREGRDFSAVDAAGGTPVVIVNESFARRFLSDGASLGRSLRLTGYDDVSRQVVGVVGDVRSFIGLPAPPTVFLPSAQALASLTKLFGSWFPAHVVVRTTGDPAAVQGSLARVIRETDAFVPVGRVRAMEEVLLGSLAFQRFVMVLLSVFAGLAIVLAAVGLYGVIAYLVAQRTHEIGVRMALGARSRDVLRMVVGRGLLLVAIGVVFGLAGALGLTRFVAGLLYDVRPTDPLTFLGVTALLVLVALVATWLPARRAARVDPMVALRYE